MGIETAILASAVIGGGMSMFGADKQASAAKDAGQLQYAAAQDAQIQQMAMFKEMQGNLKPYMLAGQNSLNQLQAGTGPNGALTTPFNPAMLESTPGYQFALSQGLKAGQNRLTTMGLGESGPAMTGAIDYATGLASNTYSQRFNEYWNQNKAIYDMLSGQAMLGSNASAGVGTAGIQTGQALGNLMTGGASALGAGGMGAANAWAGAFGNFGQNLGNAGMMLAMNQNGLFATPQAAPQPYMTGRNAGTGIAGYE